MGHASLSWQVNCLDGYLLCHRARLRQPTHSPLALWRGAAAASVGTRALLALACPQAMLPGKKVGKSAKHSRVHKRLSTE